MSNTPKMLFTKNLDMFKFHDVNRDFNTPESRNRINKIAQSMKDEGLKVQPITVTSKNYIVDGQHRVCAAKKVGCGIWYIVDYTIKNTAEAIYQAAASLNRYSKDWSKENYIKGQVVMGNENFITLEKFRNDFPMFSLTDCMFFLRNSGTRNPNKEKFSKGEFIVENETLARKYASNILKLKPHFEKGYNTAVFVRTMLSIFEKKPEFDFNRFLHKVNLQPTALKKISDKSENLLMIEDIYNYRAQNGDRLNLRF